MLGDQICEMHGKRTSRRVLAADAGFKVEVSFEESGKMLGIEATDMGTYISVNRPDGGLFGEGHGVLMTRDGDTATWKGSGVGKFLPGGAVSFRGAVYYTTASPKLLRLNGIAVVFEHEVDADGNTHTKNWEWK